jgi:hypothetical protein
MIHYWRHFIEQLCRKKTFYRMFDRLGFPQVQFSLEVTAGKPIGYSWNIAGYTDRKLTQLKSVYFGEPEFYKFIAHIKGRIELGHPFSVSYVFNSGKEKKVQNSGIETMGRCLQTMNFVGNGKGGYCIDVNMRASEVIRALLADMKFINDYLIGGICSGIEELRGKKISLRFNIAWAVLDPAALFIYLRMSENIYEELDVMKAKNPTLFKNFCSVLRSHLYGKKVNFEKTMKLRALFLKLFKDDLKGLKKYLEKSSG